MSRAQRANAAWRSRVVASCAALFALAAALRLLPWHRVFTEERVRFFGGDAFYHARRALWSAAHFPASLDRDPTVRFPSGGEPIWSPLFDLACAALLRASVGTDPEAAERVLVMVPVALGAATVAAVAALAWRLDGPRSAWASGLLLALLPGHFAYTRLGYLDHHAAVSLASTVLVAAAMAWVARPRPPAAAALGAALALSLLLWPGMVLHVAVVEVALVGWLLTRRAADEARRAAAGLAAAHALALAAVAPFAWGRSWERWGTFSPLVLSDFQPWLLATAAAAFGLFALGCRGRGPLAPGRRAGLAAGAAALALAPTALLLPTLGRGLADAFAWFATTERFQAEVSESRPLFTRRGRLTVGPALAQLSGIGLLAPLWIAWLACTARRTARPALGVLAVTSAGLGVATLVQTRFVDAFAPLLALSAGLCLAAGSRRLARVEPRARRRALGALAGAGLALALAPALAPYAPFVRDLLAAHRGAPPGETPREARERMLLQVADWLREHTPAEGDPLDPGDPLDYAVLSHWADGHLLRYVARRPVAVDNFGDDVGEDNFARAEAYYRAETEQEALALLHAMGVRYVVFEYRPIAARAAMGPRTMFARLYLGDGAETDRPFLLGDREVRRTEEAVPALERHRLVYETPGKPVGTGRPGFKVFERVAGAVLAGRAPPGARVEASLPLRTNTGRDLIWAGSSSADAEGRFRLRVPYATQGAPPSVTPAPRVQLEAAGRRAAVAVPEAAVQEGLRVVAPSLGEGT